MGASWPGSSATSGWTGSARPWLASSALVLPVLIIVSLWQALGFYLLIYFAGLQGIDPGLFESATVDGATGWQLTRYITVPRYAR